MLSKILDALKSKPSLEKDKDGNPPSEQLQIATAVLLFNVAGSDADFDPVEVRATYASIGSSFGLDDSQTMDILSKAEEKFKANASIDEDVELVNTSYDERQRQLIFCLAWNGARRLRYGPIRLVRAVVSAQFR